MPQDPKTFRQKTLDMARIYLAAGVDPEKSTIFIQSDVSEHAELTWTLNCIARMGELERMTQFKEKAQKATSSIRNTDDLKNLAQSLEKIFTVRQMKKSAMSITSKLVNLLRSL